MQALCGGANYVWWCKLCVVVQTMYGDANIVWRCKLCVAMQTLCGGANFVWRCIIMSQLDRAKRLVATFKVKVTAKVQLLIKSLRSISYKLVNKPFAA